MIRLGERVHTACEEDWLRDRIACAAEACGRGDFWMAGDVAHGLVDYLEHAYEGTAIDLPELIGKLKRLLEQIDCKDVAGHLDASPPPMPVELTGLATDAGNGFELFFFRLLDSHITSLAQVGVREVRLTGMRSCVRQLRGARRWRRDCDRLVDEILAFIRSKAMHPSLLS
jgi:hypothetical protein